MPVKNRFQYQVATGRTTLPVAVLLSFVLWAVTCRELEQLLSVAVCACITYLLIELNTAFALIRTRTTLPSALFLICFSACPFLHPFSWLSLLPLLFVAMVFSLFRSFESPFASTTIFHAFGCLGLMGMIAPKLLYLLPLLFLLMAHLRSLNLRTFFAGLLGALAPYWLWGCWLLYAGGWKEAVEAFVAGFLPEWPDYTCLHEGHMVSAGIVVLIAVACTVQSISHTYQDKVQTRILLQVLMVLEIVTAVGIVLQPQLIEGLFPVLLVCASVFFGHTFALIFSRFTDICFRVICSLVGGLILFNLWLHFFPF